MEFTPDSELPNMQEGLIPPNGMWRGSTVDSRLTRWSGTYPDVMFEDVWNEDLHIFRTFRSMSNRRIRKELGWIQDGGILFYSIQPKTWSEYSQESGIKDWEIRKYANAIAEVKPHKVMVPVGFEPNEYVNPASNKYQGSAADYKAMWANFVKIFEEQEADNVVWVMDYSFSIRNEPQLAVDLWPEGNVVQWLFFNIF